MINSFICSFFLLMYSTVLLQVFSCFQQDIFIDLQTKHPWFTFTLCMLCDLPLSLRNLAICNEKPIRRLSLLQVLCYCMNFYQLRVSFLSPTERSKGLTWYYRKSSGEKSLLVTCCRQEKLWWPNALLQTNNVYYVLTFFNIIIEWQLQRPR